MTVSSNNASEIFASVWSLILLGALRRSGARKLPFDDEWRRQADRHHDDLAGIRVALESIHGFTPSIADMLLTDTPWRAGAPEGYLTTPEAIDAELAMMVGARAGELERTIDTPASTLEARAVRRQLAQLLNGLLAAAFQVEPLPAPSVQMRLILGAAAALAEELDTTSALRDAAAEWRAVFLPGLRDAAGFEAWATRALVDICAA